MHTIVVRLLLSFSPVNCRIMHGVRHIKLLCYSFTVTFSGRVPTLKATECDVICVLSVTHSSELNSDYNMGYTTV
jgi:hypothetical protein